MPVKPTVRPQRDERFPMAVVFTLAAWRIRTTWFMLLVITFGMVAAVVIAWTIPLLSDVMTTAGLRTALRGAPDSAEITLNTATERLSTPIVRTVHNQFDQFFQHTLGNSLHVEQSAIIDEDFSFSPPRKNTSVTVYGTSLQQAASHFGSIQGRIAQRTSATDNEIEVMMTPETAKQLGVQLGSVFNLSLSYIDATAQQEQQVSAHVVGLFQITSTNSPYWHSNDFNPETFVSEGTSTLYKYTLLVPDDALLALTDHINALSHIDVMTSPASDGYTLLRYYQLNTASITIHNLDAFINQFATLRSTTDSLYGNLELGTLDTIPVYPYIFRLDLTSPLLSSSNTPSILESFRTRIDVAQIPVGIFALLSIALILFFVSLMTAVLVDRQADTLALLRSRGASSGQVFGVLFLQSVVLGGIALVIGLPVALLTVFILAQRVLPAGELDALNIITSSPVQEILGKVVYALAVVLVALLTMSISLFSATRMDVLSMRKESARSGKRPLWQRFNLDVIAGVVALMGYCLSLYITSVGNVLSNDAQVLIATPLSLVTPFFLIVGCLLLFLRIFPWLLRLGARLAARGRGAVSMLAFAQIARSPRQSLRLTMLLALAITFTIFTLVYNATEVEHIQKIVDYETGADISAQLFSNGASLSQVIQQYQGLPGVLSASAGRADQGYGGTADLPMTIREVDVASFSRTVIWPSTDAFQKTSPLLSKLIALRQSSVGEDVVPAIVTQTTIDKLLLHVGSTFTMTLNSNPPLAMNCKIVGVVDSIPTINDRTVPAGGEVFTTVGGVLVDYQTYAKIFVQDAKNNKQWIGQVTPPDINQLWLRTRSDAVSLASLRTALNNPEYRLSQLVDRRLILTTLQSDPLYLILVGILGLGTVAALLLTFIGDLLVSWLSAYTRLTSFAMLRALGITSRQVANMLTWEQVIVYVTGLLLGGGFGALLSYSVIPALTFTNNNTNLSSTQFFALQSALATQLVIPQSIALLLLVLVIIYSVALTIMVRVTTRSVLGQALRLNED